MKRFNFILSLPLLLLFSLTFWLTSCKKDNNSSDDVVGIFESVEDDNIADFNYDSNIDQSLDMAAEKDPNLFGTAPMVSPRLSGTDTSLIPRCPIIKKDRDVFPITVTIDFDPKCVGPDGRHRSGKIIIVYTGKMRDSGSVATTTFENFYVDSVKVEGIHKFTNSSEQGKPIFIRQIIGGKLTWPGGGWVKRNALKKVEMIKGADTFGSLQAREDDEFRITGGAEGENSRGKTWTSEITNPIIKRFDCRWIISGIVRFRHNAVVGSLNYGDGNCDNKALLTINDRSKEITLR